LLITLAAVLLTSFVAGVLWHWILNADIPTFVIGVSRVSLSRVRVTASGGVKVC
jgi:hypothetical protein